jgi:Flp pilus assembly protein TadG
MSALSRLLGCRRAATAAEFALVIPLFLLFIFAIIDAGRFMWAANRLEKATHMGVRFAVVTNMVASGLGSYDFVAAGITQGTTVPTSSFGKISCTSTSCTCATSPCPSLTRNATAFTNIVTRMQAIDSAITPANVIVEYENALLGVSGNPNGPDVLPLTTVRLTGVTFSPITPVVWSTLNMPGFKASLTMEDGAGTASN